MRYTTLVVAAFLALTSGITAAPIDARTQKSPSYSKSVLSNNKDNGFVAFSGNGGNGGTNYAVPIAVSGASSKNGKVKGTVITDSAAGNIVEQSANGGDGSAVGTFGSGNKFSERGGTPVYVAPSVDVLSNNDDNGIVVGSGNGGAGGTNVAIPIALSGAKSSNGKVKGGKVITGSKAGNAVGQSANGGDGSAVGTYGSGNKFYERDPTNSGPSFEYLSGNSGNGIVVGSGNGGNGGKNIAVPVAISGAKSSNGKVWGGKVVTGSKAGNLVGQSADGGDGSAVGSYGSDNHFGA